MRLPLPFLAVVAASAIVPLAAGCGHPAPPPKTAVAVEKPPPRPPPPPPPCVKVGAQMSAVGSPTADDHDVKFCVSDGESNACYAATLDGGALSREDGPSPAQPTALGDVHARVDTTPTEVKVCVGETCKSYKPRVPKTAENPLEAVASADGALSVVLLGDAEQGKGVAEVWDVKKGRRVARIRYAHGDDKCGHARVLGQTVFISADVCAGPDAHAALYTSRGRKLADVGGKQFGTWGTEPVQVSETVWAFLEQNGAAIALQDVKTGKVVKTIDVGAAWAKAGGDGAKAGGATADGETPDGAAAAAPDAGKPDAAPDASKPAAPDASKPAAPDAAPAHGNPGESALVRGPAGKLVVITGGPTPGNLAIVDTESGDVKVVEVRRCAAQAAAPPPS